MNTAQTWRPTRTQIQVALTLSAAAVVGACIAFRLIYGHFPAWPWPLAWFAIAVSGGMVGYYREWRVTR